MMEKGSNPAAVSASVPDIGRCVQTRATAFVDLLGRLRKEHDVDLVHDIRVASRRLNESLGLVGTVLGPPIVEPHRLWLRRMRDLVAPIRDADVLGQIVISLIGQGRCECGVLSEDEFIRDLNRQRQTRLIEARRELETPETLERCQTLAARLTELVRPSVDREMLEGELARRLRRRVRRRRRALLRLGDKAAKSPRPKRLHAARIAAKKLRYALELAHDARILDAAGEVQTLRLIQDVLGDLNDLSVLVERLKEFAGGIRVSRTSGVGRLLEWVALRRERLLNRTVRRWPKIRRQLRRTKARRIHTLPLSLKLSDWTDVSDRSRRAAN